MQPRKTRSQTEQGWKEEIKWKRAGSVVEIVPSKPTQLHFEKIRCLDSLPLYDWMTIY